MNRESVWKKFVFFDWLSLLIVFFILIALLRNGLNDFGDVFNFIIFLGISLIGYFHLRSGL